MDIEDWQKIRAFVIQADKKNKNEEVGQAYGRDNNWNKGSGVN
jgi:hypothetical protein